MPADSQKQGKAKSGGQRIDDHSSWMGSSSQESPLPLGGAKVKYESSAEGAGSEMDYEDTSEKIKAAQMKGVEKIKAHPMKPLYRG